MIDSGGFIRSTRGKSFTVQAKGDVQYKYNDEIDRKIVDNRGLEESGP